MSNLKLVFIFDLASNLYILINATIPNIIINHYQRFFFTYLQILKFA